MNFALSNQNLVTIIKTFQQNYFIDSTKSFIILISFIFNLLIIYNKIYNIYKFINYSLIIHLVVRTKLTCCVNQIIRLSKAKID